MLSNRTMDTIIQTYNNRVLEPLSQATETILEPLNLMPNDFLLIGIDEDAKRFVIKICTLREYSNEDKDKTILDCPDVFKEL